jgi:hypothetical protein
VSGHDFSRAKKWPIETLALAPAGVRPNLLLSLSGFYETAGVVKVLVFAFVFSFLAFLLLFLYALD